MLGWILLVVFTVWGVVGEGVAATLLGLGAAVGGGTVELPGRGQPDGVADPGGCGGG